SGGACRLAFCIAVFSDDRSGRLDITGPITEGRWPRCCPREPHSPPPAQYTFWKRGWKIGPVVAASEIGGRFGIAANVLIATTAAIARTIAKRNLNIGRG